MDALELARWQFAATTVYHFVFVPLTIGLAPLVALMQTFWYRTGDERWFKLTRFFGKLLLINFAIGIATGIVQEFQFGMNWSEYSRFVGDVFGAPLAMEGLAAFFLESTFLGLWIFGWDRLPRSLHLASIWLFATGTWLSAYFILAANSFMQHPVGVTYNEELGRAELTSIWALLTNSTTLKGAFPHTIAAALITAGAFVAGIAVWWMVKAAKAGRTDLAKTYRLGAIVGMWTILVSGIGLSISGDVSAKLMFEQQPMKMAAAEGLCESGESIPFSVLSIGDLTNDCENVSQVIEVPGLTSYLATGDFGAQLNGANELQKLAEERYGPGDYTPNLLVTYWTFRLMIGFGLFAMLLASVGLWLTRKGATPAHGWLGKLALITIPMPFLAAGIGWIFTEMGRQPWVVAPNPGPSGVDGVWMLVADGVSNHPAWLVATSLAVFVLMYGVLMVFWYRLMTRYARTGLDESETPPDQLGEDDDAPLAFAY
ncbi:MAG: cytochrome ubiquinol oxidase subunit I [Micrococcales bacterium]|nr:MAG: cytochrome ubiquinol oxidase subunit I [Micrococcales bacterium]PIE28041.1 MAG: cytochrome ubiquinol oxidase subunit I [Micrococcales bacterium]